MIKLNKDVSISFETKTIYANPENFIPEKRGVITMYIPGSIYAFYKLKYPLPDGWTLATKQEV